MSTITAAAGGGNWSAGATWTGGVVPTASDDVLLANTSGNVTIDVASVCRSLNCTGYTGTLVHTTAITLTIGSSVAGLGNVALLLVSSMTYTLGNATTSALVFVSTSVTVQTITTGGKTLGNWTINGAGSSYQLADANTTGSTSIVTVTAGSLNTNGQACAWGQLSSTNTNVRSVSFGASVLTMTLNNANAVDFGVSSNLAFSAGTSVINSNGINSGVSAGGLTFNNVVFGAIGAVVIAGGGTFANMTRNAQSSSRFDSLQFAGNPTITGTLTVNGLGSAQRVLVQSNGATVSRTVTVGSLITSYSDWGDLTAAGAANWNLASITGGSGDQGGNSGITFTTPVTQTWVGSSGGLWSTNAWATRVPLPQDPVVITGAFAGASISLDLPRMGASFDCSGVTGSLTLLAGSAINGNISNYGSWTLSSAITLSSAQAIVLSFAGRSTHTITWAGNNPNWGFIFSGGGTYTMQDALAGSLGSGLNLLAGTLNTNNQTLSIATFTSTSNITRSLILGTSIVNVISTAAVQIWNITSVAFALSAANSTIVITTASANTRTFSGLGLTYGTLTYAIAGSTGALALNSSGTFNTLNFSDASNARSLIITPNNLQQITNFNVFGTAGKLMSIVSSVPGLQTVMAKLGSGFISVDYVSIQDSKIQSTNAGYAGLHSTNVSNNSNWVFNVPPITQPAIARISNFKSSTQPAIGRIANNKALTQSAIARIALLKTTTQLAVARIARSVTKTQTATARVANLEVKTQAAIARIARNNTKTQSALARIRVNGSRNQSAKAAIVARVSATQSATASITQLEGGTGGTLVASVDQPARMLTKVGTP